MNIENFNFSYAGAFSSFDDLVINFFDGTSWVEVNPTDDNYLKAVKLAAKKIISDYAEKQRHSFTSGVGAVKLSGFQINSDILNLIDAGVSIENLDPYLKNKIDVEVANDDRYTTTEELLAVWRLKRGGLSVASAWVGALENNTITSLNSAETVFEIEQLLFDAKAIADAKLIQLIG